MNDPFLAVMQFMEQRFQAVKVPLGLVTCAIDKSMAAHPRYPANPRQSLPRLLLSGQYVDPTAQVSNGANFQVYLTAWYYRLQTPGQEHQILMLADMKQISEVILGRYGLGSQNGVKLNAAFPIREALVAEQMHPSRDPALTVSVGQLSYRVEAQSY